MRRTVAFAALALVAACAAQSGVVDLGDDTYFVSKQAATGFSGMGNLRDEVLREAVARCAGRLVVLIEEHQTQPPYLPGNPPRIDLKFRCE